MSTRKRINVPIGTILLEVEKFELLPLTDIDKESLQTDKDLTHVLCVRVRNQENASDLWLLAWPQDFHKLKDQLLPLPDNREEEQNPH